MSDLLVAGLVYLEIHLPEGAAGRRPDPGRERFVPELPLRLGGAINVASVLSALDAPVRLATPIGHGPTGRFVRAYAADLGLPVLEWPALQDGSISIVFHEANDRAFISTADFLALEKVTELPAAAWIHIPGLREARALRPALSLARMRGSSVSLNLSWDPEGFDLLRGDNPLACDLLVMNELEATELAGSPGEALRRFGPKVKRVVVTLGSGGALAMFDGHGLEIEAIDVQTVDPTGAGDAFCAGLLAAIYQGHSAEIGISWGTQAAARVLQIYGGVLDQKLPLEARGN